MIESFFLIIAVLFTFVVETFQEEELTKMRIEQASLLKQLEESSKLQEAASKILCIQF